MSRRDSIFDPPGADPAAVDDLPPELEGKSPKEIAAYYQRREAVLLDRARKAQPPVKEPPKPDKIDIFGDPTAQIDDRIRTNVNEGINRAATVISPAVIQSCKIVLRDKYPDSVRFMAEIDKRMSKMTPEGQMNPDYWDITYKTVKGEQADVLRDEAVAAERKKFEKGAEDVTPSGGPPPKPKELDDDQKTMAKKFGMTGEDYRTASERYDTTDGVLPFTYDSRVANKKKAG